MRGAQTEEAIRLTEEAGADVMALAGTWMGALLFTCLDVGQMTPAEFQAKVRALVSVAPSLALKRPRPPARSLLDVPLLGSHANDYRLGAEPRRSEWRIPEAARQEILEAAQRKSCAKRPPTTTVTEAEFPALPPSPLFEPPTKEDP